MTKDSDSLLLKEIDKLKKQLAKQKSIESIITTKLDHILSKNINIGVPKSPEPDNRNVDTEIAVLHVSDTQIGKWTKSYNTEIAENRLLLLADKTAQIANVRRGSAKIEELRIYLGGDIVEGEEIFSHQSHEIDSNVFDQAIVNGAEMLVKMTLRLLESFQKVRIVGVPGNHGRNGRYGGSGSPDTNWDRVCYATMNKILRGSKAFPRTELEGRLEFPTDYNWYYVDKVFGWGNLIVHGDQVSGGGNGVPFNSIRSRVFGWIDSLPESFDNVFIGHFHTLTNFMANKRTILINGTTESDNKFAQSQLGATGYPCQRLCFFNQKHGLISDNPIYLTNKRVPNK